MLELYIRYGALVAICFLLLGITIMCIKFLRQNFRNANHYAWWIETLTTIEWTFLMLFSIDIIVYVIVVSIIK